MSSEATLDLEELFGLEEPPNDVKEKAPAKGTKEPEEGDDRGDQAEPKVEPADGTHQEGTVGEPEGTGGTAKQPRNKGKSGKDREEDPARGSGGKGLQRESGKGDTGTGKTAVSESVEPLSNEWHKNIVGNPKGRPNPYFQGIVASDGFDGKQILVPFKDVAGIQRQLYVDDIHNENPSILTEIYRIRGTFPDIIARITKDVFDELIKHPEVKKAKVNYSWVSDHKQPRRNYIVSHDGRPTLEELKLIDKHQDEVEWALKPWHEREALKKADKKYADMPKDEEIPLPVEEEPATEPEEQPEE